MDYLPQCLTILFGEEGGFGTDPNDPGNWTGGLVGIGQNNGTKYGISARAYPTLDIEGLTKEKAGEIYRTDYWLKTGCDKLRGPLALCVFDAAVNSGSQRAARWLQRAVNVYTDGVVGPVTLAAANAMPIEQACSEFLVQRLLYVTELPLWSEYSLGWSRRLMALPFKAMKLTGG